MVVSMILIEPKTALSCGEQELVKALLVVTHEAETGDASIIWEGHKAGREIGYCHMEKLSNLDALPDHGFKVACFPVKIERASAGWTRAVAIIEE